MWLLYSSYSSVIQTHLLWFEFHLGSPQHPGVGFNFLFISEEGVPVTRLWCSGGKGGDPSPRIQQAILGQQPHVLQFDLTLSLPGGSIRSCRLSTQPYKIASPPTPPPTTHTVQTPISSLVCYLYFRPTGCKSESPKTPFLGSFNLLDWLTELRKPVYSLDYQFITKEL